MSEFLYPYYERVIPYTDDCDASFSEAAQILGDIQQVGNYSSNTSKLASRIALVLCFVLVQFIIGLSILCCCL